MFLVRNQRSGALAERGEHAHRHAIFSRKLHGTGLQHLGTKTRKLEHLLHSQAVEPARFRHDARIGGEHALDIGVDPALGRLERRRQRHRRRVRPAAAERRDIALLIDALKTSDHHDSSAIEILSHPRGVDVENPRSAVGIVRQYVNLAAGVGAGVESAPLQRHREQRDGHLLARRQQDVHLALRRVRINLVRQRNETVGLATHRRDDHNEVVAPSARCGDDIRDGVDALNIRDGGAAELFNDQCHRLSPAMRQGLPSALPSRAADGAQPAARTEAAPRQRAKRVPRIAHRSPAARSTQS